HGRRRESAPTGEDAHPVFESIEPSKPTHPCHCPVSNAKELNAARYPASREHGLALPLPEAPRRGRPQLTVEGSWAGLTRSATSFRPLRPEPRRLRPEDRFVSRLLALTATQPLARD